MDPKCRWTSKLSRQLPRSISADFAHIEHPIGFPPVRTQKHVVRRNRHRWRQWRKCIRQTSCRYNKGCFGLGEDEWWWMRLAVCILATGYGAKVALIERGAQWDSSKRKRLSAGPGGTCVNVGCVPRLGNREWEYLTIVMYLIVFVGKVELDSIMDWYGLGVCSGQLLLHSCDWAVPWQCREHLMAAARIYVYIIYKGD